MKSAKKSERGQYQIPITTHRVTAEPIHPFIEGDVYLFSRDDELCRTINCLWGEFSKIENGAIYLNNISTDCEIFIPGEHRLPDGYRFYRRSTRAELRDFSFNKSSYEVHHGLL